MKTTAAAILLSVAFIGCSSQKIDLSRPAFGVQEVDEAVQLVKVGETTFDEVEDSLGPYIQMRGLRRVKETGEDRKYYAVPENRQIWFQYSLDDDGVWRVIDMGKLEPKGMWITHEGGYLTFSPTEEPW